MEITRCGLVDVATRPIDSRIWNLGLQMVRAVFGQNDIGQLECFLTEIPIFHDSLFGGQLTRCYCGAAKRVVRH